MATKQEIKEWLKRQGHNEEWFAEQLNIPYFLYWYASDEEIYPEYWDEFVNLIMRPRKINLFFISVMGNNEKNSYRMAVERNGCS